MKNRRKPYSKSFFLLVFFTCFALRSFAQWGVSAELLVAKPLYFERAETGLTTSNLQKGFRLTGSYYLGTLDDNLVPFFSFRFTRHLASVDSATVDASYFYSGFSFPLKGTGRTVFGSFVPQFSTTLRSKNNEFLSYRFAVGIGACWARCRYHFPGFDPRTMEYSNAPWHQYGDYNDTEKLVSIKPCMPLSAGVQYEFAHFFLFGNIDLTYAMGNFPPNSFSASVGVFVPIDVGRDYSAE